MVPFGSLCIYAHMPAQKTSQLTSKRMSNRFSSSCRMAISEQSRINAETHRKKRNGKFALHPNIIIASLFCSSVSCTVAAAFTKIEAHFVPGAIVISF